MGNSNCKKDYSKGEVKYSRNYSNKATENEEECSRLWQVFIVWLVKFWGKNSILSYYQKGKNSWFVLFLKRKKLTTFLCNSIFIDIFSKKFNNRFHKHSSFYKL